MVKICENYAVAQICLAAAEKESIIYTSFVLAWRTYSSGFPAGQRNHPSSLPLICFPVEARLPLPCVFSSSPACSRLISALSVNTQDVVIVRDYFVCLCVCVLRLQKWGLQVRHKRKKIVVTSSCRPRFYFFKPRSIFIPRPLFHIRSCLEHVSCFYLLSITPRHSAAPLF